MQVQINTFVHFCFVSWKHRRRKERTCCDRSQALMSGGFKRRVTARRVRGLTAQWWRWKEEEMVAGKRERAS